MLVGTKHSFGQIFQPEVDQISKKPCRWVKIHEKSFFGKSQKVFELKGLKFGMKPIQYIY